MADCPEPPGSNALIGHEGDTGIIKTALVQGVAGRGESMW